MVEKPEIMTSYNILAVDDTPAHLSLLVQMLTRLGYIVRPARSGAIALQAAELEPPDLILLDVMMPEMDGYEVCRRLKENKALLRIPVIFISALSETFDKVKAFSLGGIDYITKPFYFEEVAARIDTQLRLYHYQSLIESWNRQLVEKVHEQTQDLRKRNDVLKLLVERYQDNFEGTLVAFSNLLDLHGSRTRIHSNHVAEISRRVAAVMGLNEKTIQRAGRLHDIGKIGMPNTLLQKDPGILPPDEREEYRQHPVRGQAALDSILDLHEVGLLIRHHHEAYDGSGYPDGLSGPNIPPGAMIIKLADSLDRALPSHGGGDDIQACLASLQKQLRTQYDPEVFRWFQQPAREYYETTYELLNGEYLAVPVRKLKAGMVLAEDLRSGTGVLILRSGVHLNETQIETVQRIYAYDPPRQEHIINVLK